MNLLANRKCLELPQRLSNIVGAAWVEHIPFAFWLMEAMRPATVVELGVWAGDSYLAWCQAAQGLGLAARVCGVDHWQGDFQTGDYGEELFQSLKSYHEERYAGFSTLMRMSFAEALPAFAERSIDLLHIDGLHTYEAVREDFESWLPKMSGRGVILFHDTVVMEREFGVWRLWAELTERYPHFSFAHGFGLGVLLVGDEVAMPVRELAGLNVETADEVRATFMQLGEHIRAIEGLAISRADVELAKKKVELTLEEKVKEMEEVVAQTRESTQATTEQEMRRRAEGELDALAGGYELRLRLAEKEIRQATEERDRAMAEQAEDKRTAEAEAAAKGAEIDALRKMIEELKGAVAGIQESRSFKVGRLITSPARLVRKAMKKT